MLKWSTVSIELECSFYINSKRNRSNDKLNRRKSDEMEPLDAAIAHLKRRDAVLRQVIVDVGPYTLKRDTNGFRMLVRSIISQQISTGAARSIRTRLETLVGTKRLPADRINLLSIEQLRSVGVSPQKAGYLLDLSKKTLDGTIRFRSFAKLSDEAIIEQLIQVKGIGRWTAQMYLIFSAGRADVFPHDDLGIRSALRDLYELPDLPDKETSHRIAEFWRPYASIASWYCWRSIDLRKHAKKLLVVDEQKNPSNGAKLRSQARSK